MGELASEHRGGPSGFSGVSDFVSWLRALKREVDRVKNRMGIEVVHYTCDCGGIVVPVLLSGEAYPCDREVSVSEYFLKVLPGVAKHGTKYLHECRECGKTHALDKVYPDLIVPCE